MKRLFFAAALCFPMLMRAQAPAGSTPAETGATTATLKLTPEQTAAILKQLDQIETTITKNRDTTLGGALARCVKAESSQSETLDLYLACYRMEHFDKLKLTTKDFTDWAKANEEKLKDPEFLYGLWLQLEYLVMSIKVQDAESLAPFISSLQSFIQKEVGAVQNASAKAPGGPLKEKPKGGNVKISTKSSTGQLVSRLRESVRHSEFSKALLLKDILKREDWEYEPLAIGNIYERIIFPYYLDNKPAELPAQWDIRIKAELALKQALSTEADYAIYLKENFPRMAWQRSRYLYDHNISPVPALGSLLQLLRENPAHPSAVGWAQELHQIINNAQPPSSPSPAVTDTTVPTPAPN